MLFFPLLHSSSSRSISASLNRTTHPPSLSFSLYLEPYSNVRHDGHLSSLEFFTQHLKHLKRRVDESHNHLETNTSKVQIWKKQTESEREREMWRGVEGENEHVNTHGRWIKGGERGLRTKNRRKTVKNSGIDTNMNQQNVGTLTYVQWNRETASRPQHVKKQEHF